MKNKILILGKGGFIAERLRGELDCDISGTILHSFTEAEREVKKYNPNVIINCIGYTGAGNVDGCEKEKDLTLFANTYMPIILAEVALRNNMKLVHISSGCIYHYDYKRDRPLTEARVPDFFGLYYSRTKIYSERALEALCGKYNILITRIRIPLDNRPHPKNILDKLISYKKVIDIPNSITYIPDFIGALKHLIRVDARGIYNVVNKGGLRYPQLLDVYKRRVPEFTYSVLELKKLDMIRTNLILSTRKLERSGFKVRGIHEVLDECVRGYVAR
ncbi:MAG: sugar nucleotide-binding protein [Candidatus Omnitrophica bacterium]|nr:sugar nucleotide-binding protein [Candidatus Omnitrophota bacterium]